MPQKPKDPPKSDPNKANTALFAGIRKGERILEMGLNEDGIMLLLWEEEKIQMLREELSGEDLFNLGNTLHVGFLMFLEKLYGGRVM